LKDKVEADHARAFAELMGKTLHEHFFSLQQTAVSMVGTFQLQQFRPELQDEAEHAATPWQRRTALRALASLPPAGS